MNRLTDRQMFEQFFKHFGWDVETYESDGDDPVGSATNVEFPPESFYTKDMCFIKFHFDQRDRFIGVSDFIDTKKLVLLPKYIERRENELL